MQNNECTTSKDCQAIALNDSTILIEQPATLEQWKTKAEELWKLLDAIDTASDMFKPEFTAYTKYVDKIVAKRGNYLESDGYNIINTTKYFPWYLKDDLGWPIEFFKNKPVTNFIRLILINSKKLF